MCEIFPLSLLRKQINIVYVFANYVEPMFLLHEKSNVGQKVSNTHCLVCCKWQTNPSQ